MNGVLDSVAVDVYPNKAVGRERSNFEFLAEKDHHFSKNGLQITLR